MRRIGFILAAVALLASACGGSSDSGLQFGDSSTTTVAATQATTPTTQAGATETAAKDREEESDLGKAERAVKRDPIDSKLQTQAKAAGTDRNASGAERLAQTSQAAPAIGERGSDPYLDSLWDDCATGDMAACDELYWISPVGSQYEAFGDTCGNTTAGGSICEDGRTGAVDTYGDDPYLDGLWDECALGGWAACDSLFVESPGGSEYEAWGATCGDTTDGFDWCTDVYLVDGETLNGLWAMCAAEDWAACDDLYSLAPPGSPEEAFGFTCGDRTDGSRWCVDEFAQTGGTYGSDPYLDSLWDDCAFGDMAACDALYSQSPVGSEYEEFGATCGFLTDGSLWCVDTGTGTGLTYGADAYLDGLWDACDAGDWDACDSLYAESPVGSEYEDFGATCGYLTDGSLWCTDEFGSGGGGVANSYGDDPYFDGLWDACAAGDWAACDTLYWETPIGSVYEDFGATCGYTTDGSFSCVETYDGGLGDGSIQLGSYGDDPYLDGLWDACSVGNWGACDDLYRDSPSGSVYEDFGGTCGYLTDGSMWCVDVYGGGGGTAYTYGDDPYLDGLWDACATGDLAACDTLYFDSPVGSVYEEFGSTCAYTTDGSILCVDAYYG